MFHVDLHAGPSEQPLPPGTNMELLDADDIPLPPDGDPPVTCRYPQRVNRHPPQRFNDFLLH